jgi:hypothetical protein
MNIIVLRLKTRYNAKVRTIKSTIEKRRNLTKKLVQVTVARSNNSMDVVLKLYVNVEAEHLLPLLDLDFDPQAHPDKLSLAHLETAVRQALRDYVFDHAEELGELDYEGVEDANLTDLLNEIKQILAQEEQEEETDNKGEDDSENEDAA